MARKCLSKRAPTRQPKGSSAQPKTRRSVKSLTAVKKRVLDRYSKAKHGTLTSFCRSKGILYQTAYSYLKNGKHGERNHLRKLIADSVDRVQLIRREKHQHRNISAAAILDELGPKKCPIGVRQINRIIAQLFKGSRPRRDPQRPRNTGITQSQLDHLNKESEEW